MAYFNEKLTLISDSSDNIKLFRLERGNIIKHYYDDKIQGMNKKSIIEDAFLEYDISIDGNNNVYLVYQDMSFDLILVLMEGEKVEAIRLTEEPISEIYYLNLINTGKEFHIFYSILLQEGKGKYRIYHHYFNGTNWVTNVVDEIKAEKLLNPFRIVRGEKELIVAYYDKIGQEQIYMKSFNLYEKKWGEKVKLTKGESSKLYVDILLMEDKINLVYSQYYEGNLIIKYERFNYSDEKIEREKEEILSNPEDAQEPILIFYEEKLWVVWLEYENILSRYSDDYGTTWSSIYLWNESKDKDIVKYKLNRASPMAQNILNYSFGKIHPDIKFLGFGSLDNTTQIPLKKKNSLNIPRI